MSLILTLSPQGVVLLSFIYLFYGKQVTNSIGYFLLFMQSVLLLHYPPILVSAGDFKLSLAFMETWKAEHLFLLLSCFISCARCFWRLGLLPFGKGGFHSCNGLFSVAVLYKKMGGWAYRPWGEVQFAFAFCICVYGQLTWQSQSKWYCAPLMERVRPVWRMSSCWWSADICPYLPHRQHDPHNKIFFAELKSAHKLF